ncbi:MAG: glycosyltransferase family 4 protein [Mangrovibacterium sp.]
MKICFIVGLYPFNKGGAEYQAKILSENFAKHHEVFFIMITPEIEDIDFYYNGVRIFNIPFSPFVNKLTLYYLICRRIKHILEIEKPHIIYHRVIMPYTWYIAKIAKMKGITLILHIASDHSVSFRNSIISRIRKLLLKDIIRLGPKILVQTPEQKLMLSKITTKNITIIPNLIYQSNTVPVLKKEKNIVWIGKAIPIKQLNIFLDIAEGMQLENPNLNFIIISRFFNDAYSLDLLKRIDSLKNIKNLGEHENEFINEYLKHKAYLLINTSSSEGFSNTFLQAWSYGVPVISLNSNPGNVFSENNVGNFCYNKPEQIQQHITKFVSSDQYYNDVSDNCIKLVKDKFSVEKLFPRYKLLFEEFV